MEAMKRITLALAIGVFGVVGCGDDDSDDKVVGPKLDGSIDSTVPDGGGDSGALACSSTTAPTANTCGGSHCQQSPAQLMSSVKTGAACSTTAEINQFCQLTSVGEVQTCILAAFRDIANNPDLTAATKACAQPKLPQYTAGCLDCFVASAVCAANKCSQFCAQDPGAPACDECRINMGCIPDFYTCAGIESPL